MKRSFKICIAGFVLALLLTIMLIAYMFVKSYYEEIHHEKIAQQNREQLIAEIMAPIENATQRTVLKLQGKTIQELTNMINNDEVKGVDASGRYIYQNAYEALDCIASSMTLNEHKKIAEVAMRKGFGSNIFRDYLIRSIQDKSADEIYQYLITLLIKAPEFDHKIADSYEEIYLLAVGNTIMRVMEAGISVNMTKIEDKISSQLVLNEWPNSEQRLKMVKRWYDIRYRENRKTGKQKIRLGDDYRAYGIDHAIDHADDILSSKKYNH